MQQPSSIASFSSAVVLVLAVAAFASACAASAAGGGPSSELAELYRADQAARERDWSRLGPDELMAIAREDAQRLARVRELAAAGALREPPDRYHAAMVLQHGTEPDDYLLAHVLAGAAALGGDERGAWLAAASLDRYLHGIQRPQWFGTQYTRTGQGPWTQDPLTTQLSDDVRAAWGVPPLARSRERLAALNAELPPSAATTAPARLPPGFFHDPGEAIDRAWDAHLAAARRKDLPGVLAMFADDALVLEVGKGPVHGRSAIEETERDALERADVGEDVHHVRHELRVEGDAAFELGTIAGSMTPKEGEPAKVVYDFMATWRCGADGEWRVACLAGRAQR